jgi:hypothetical protein
MQARLRVGGAALAVLVAAAPVAVAADEWQHTAAVYVLGAGLSGESTVEGVDVDVDLSFSEVLDNLEMAGMAAYRGERGQWAVMANAFFVGLGATKDLSIGGAADVDADLAFLEIDGAYAITERLEVLFGLRGVAVDMAAEVRIPSSPTVTGDQGKSWIDPLVGVRLEIPIGKQWSWVSRGDIGGFGVGSDLAWQAATHFDWRISSLVGMAFGYEALDMDYTDGEGADEFRYDMIIQGPFVAVTFAF